MRTRAPLTIVLATALLAGSGPAIAGDPTAPGRPASEPASATPRPDGHTLPRDTSDNQPGWIAPTVPRTARAVPVTRTTLRRFRVAPGIIQRTFQQVDARGPIRAHLLRVKWRQPGLRIDYADRGSIRTVGTVRDIVRSNKAVAGVNGDFYDIGRTGAPLGMGKERARSLLHGAASTWNAGFFIGAAGRPRIADIQARVIMKNHPEIPINGVNIPHVPPDGIVVYNRRWGKTAGYQVTDGQKTDVYAVSVVDGKVVAARPDLSRGRTIEGSLYIGRGQGAALLRTLRRGMAAAPAYGVVGGPRAVITGNRILVLDGVATPNDDRVMHPRTAVGIDEDTHEVLMVVVDGRTKRSRGYTMKEMADLMLSLGAESALNLDGGGSSTMVARNRAGRLGVMNRPSDGVERRVANALEVVYRKPRKK